MPEVPVPDGRPCTVCWQPWVEHAEQQAERCAETVVSLDWALGPFAGSVTGPAAASLCAGIGGLDLALETLGYRTAWQVELDPDASTVLEHRFPGVPNLGDLTAITDPPPVDAVVAGFPCQPVSTAGRRRGIDDERWLWDDIADLLRRMEPRPRFVYLENVAGLLTANDGAALACVLHDLDALRFDAEWACLRASDVGAPHQRNRWWLVAHAADADGAGLEGRTAVPERRGERTPRSSRLESLADADGERRDRLEEQHSETPPRLDRPPRRHPHRRGMEDHRPRQDRPPIQWGVYAAAVHRWERILGRPAPAPTDHAGRLSPEFVEWMMGYPAGWVTDLNLTRNAMLRCLGNAVVPQQAVAAYTALHTRLEEAAA